MNKERNKKLEEVLGSLDGTKRAAMPDFFYTRLKARMLVRLEEGGEKGVEPSIKKSWVLRPVFALAALVLVLLINAAVILKGNSVNENISGDTDTLQSIAAEYSLNDNNAILFDITQDK